jgi:hypothetical protein
MAVRSVRSSPSDARALEGVDPVRHGGQDAEETAVDRERGRVDVTRVIP